MSRFEKHLVLLGAICFLVGGFRGAGDNHSIVVYPFIPTLFWGGIVLGLLAALSFFLRYRAGYQTARQAWDELFPNGLF